MDTGQYHISTRTRHLRYLFLIGEDYSPSDIRALMLGNMKSWGGRYNPMIPVVGNIIDDNYLALMHFYDPDVIFYSSSVNIDLVIKLSLFNPSKFVKLNPDALRLEGVNSLYFQSENEKYRPAVSNIAEIPAVLKSFFLLNFLISDETYKPRVVSGKEIFSADLTVYKSMNHFIVSQQPELKSLLSTKNINTVIVRDEELSTYTFEIVLAKNVDSIQDLFYFWNRQLYIEHDSIRQLFITQEELDELLTDPYFENLLYKYTYSEINVTSFSFSNDEVKNIITEKIQPFSKRVRVVCVNHEKFPFKILDAQGHHDRMYSEAVNKHVFLGEKGLLYFPALSIGQVHHGAKWALDLGIEKVDTSLKRQLKFPYTFEQQYFTHCEGRVNKRRNISLFVSNLDSNTELGIPSFREYVRQLISNPKIYDILTKTKYKEVSVSSDGSKLNAFINLFDQDLDAMHVILYDKFWFDLITDLSSNTRIAGDTITFDEIKTRCLGLMASNRIEINNETFRSEKNLEKGIRYALNNFCERGIFFIGFKIRCSTCTSKFWYSLEESKGQISCKGCGNPHQFPIQIPFSYKLNELVKNNFCLRDATGRFKPDGNITVLKTIINLSQKGHKGFEYSPQLNIYENYADIKPITDIDIVALPDGKLNLGECKHSSGAFSEDGNRPLNNLISIAKTLSPDKIVISCTEDSHDRLANSKKYLEHHLKGLPIEIEAIQVTAAFYNFGSPLYFCD